MVFDAIELELMNKNRFQKNHLFIVFFLIQSHNPFNNEDISYYTDYALNIKGSIKFLYDGKGNIKFSYLNTERIKWKISLLLILKTFNFLLATSYLLTKLQQSMTRNDFILSV